MCSAPRGAMGSPLLGPQDSKKGEESILYNLWTLHASVRKPPPSEINFAATWESTESFTCHFCKISQESFPLLRLGNSKILGLRQHNCEEIKNNVHGFIRNITVDPCKFE